MTKLAPLLLLLAGSALAHEIVRDGNVGALLHIEPDDKALVGTPNPTWFETNQRGGKPITLANCECVLNVYLGAVQPGEQPLLTPKLKVVKNRLGTDLTFPSVGAYTLVLTGQPKDGATFNAFKLEWVVRAGSAGHDH